MGGELREGREEGEKGEGGERRGREEGQLRNGGDREGEINRKILALANSVSLRQGRTETRCWGRGGRETQRPTLLSTPLYTTGKNITNNINESTRITYILSDLCFQREYM